MGTWNPRANELFLRAIEITSPEERRAYLLEACDGDEDLLDRVNALLDAIGQAGSFLESPAPGAVPADVSIASEEAGAVIGPYKVLQPLGEGGMGTVFMAEQEHPVRRKVALKIVKPGMDSKQVIARFEAERQALALMDHPNIAKVLDAGTTGAGRPFFVMELVKGVPITRYCDEHGRTLRGRVELFLSVCHAVQHAHQKGVVHRDLKPSNVLVASYDGVPIPKVIDFGVAKATGPKLTDATLFTEFGAIVGTLEYMSPEQAELNQLDVDTRSDIYALGVLLYELLTGTTPLDRRRLKDAAILELLRVIREEEPPRPSVRLDTTEELPAIAERRGLVPRRLSGLVRGELDWIVMKCLEKVRDRRYETANALAVDLRRYLNGEPVAACPPSATYRLRKFLVRYRGRVLAAALVLLALIVGFIGTAWGLLRATRAVEAESLARRAEVARRREAEAVADLLQSTFEGIDPYSEEVDIVPQLLAKLDRIAEDLGDDEDADPATRARLLVAVGTTMLGLGEPEKAIPLLRRALRRRTELLGEDHPETREAAFVLGRALHQVNQYEEAAALMERGWEGRKARLGPDHPGTLEALNELAWSLKYSGRRDRSLPMLQDALERSRAANGDDHPVTGRLLATLSDEFLHVGDYDRGLPLLEEVLDWQGQHLGPHDPVTLETAFHLAFVRLIRREYEPALPLLEQVLKGRKARLGADHRNSIYAREVLAEALRRLGRFEQEEVLCRELVECRRRVNGIGSPETAGALGALALNQLRQGRYAEAERASREALAIRLASAEPDAWSAYSDRSVIGAALAGQGRLDEAEPLLVAGCEGLAERSDQIPMISRGLRLTEAYHRLVHFYEDRGQPDAADRWREEAEQLGLSVDGPLPTEPP